MKHTFSLRVLLLLLCTLVSISAFYAPDMARAEDEELKGVWVSTVSNIDYPSSPTENAEALKSELIKILDNCADMGFNAVFFQVRPASDAFYKSEIFPWSRYLTGTQGKAPADNFDPLEFAVSQAHKRGIELHAWINPYRVTASASDADKLASTNPAVLNPDLVLYDSNGKMYYNPGDRSAIELIVKGAEEIVKNYDVDGIHLDDYFYPETDFNDETTYSYYKNEYSDIKEWRRANVDTLVKTLDERLHAIDKDIQFGISPRGIWANKSEMAEGSDTNGSGSYTKIYADSRGWVKKGIVDYIMPQIYWNIGYEIADYTTLCNWWADVVKDTDVKLYIGEGAYRTTSDTAVAAWTGENGTNELKVHIENGRQNPQIKGYCCFTYNDFLENPSIYQLFKQINKQEFSQDTVQVSAPNKQENALSGTPLLPDENYTNKFTDMNDYWWAMDSVNDLASRGIIKGRSETEFAPDANITRADNTVLLLRVLGKTTDFSDNFDDVYEGSYYYNELGMAKQLGIASGVGDNKFDPDALVKRQDMATLAYRVLAKEGIVTSIPNTTNLNQFIDADKIDFYAREAMSACVAQGLMSGYGDNTINPQGNATRIEVALFIHRIFKLLI